MWILGLKGLRNQNSTLLFIGQFDVVLEMGFTLWNCLCPTLLSNIVIANNGSSGVHRTVPAQHSTISLITDQVKDNLKTTYM